MTAMELLARLLSAPGPLKVDGRAEGAAVLLEADGCTLARGQDSHGNDTLGLVQTGPSVWGDYLRHALRPRPTCRGLPPRRQHPGRRPTPRPHAAAGTVATVPWWWPTSRPPAAAASAAPGTARRARPSPSAPSSAPRVRALTGSASPPRWRCARPWPPPLRAAGHPCRIKWPNDLYVGDRKLAGILVERADSLATIGVGINVTLDPAGLPDHLGATGHQPRVAGSAP